MRELFDFPPQRHQARTADLDQYFTPEWAAEELVHAIFPDLCATDLVVEPSCGHGAFLKALPPHVPAIGCEIDHTLAIEARLNTGREIRCGDFREIELPPATVVLGNPPFDMAVFDGFLQRANHLLPEQGRCGFLLPAYAVQTPSRVLRWNEVWTLQQWLVPRTLFQRARLPLIFVSFTKEPVRRLIGFLIYGAAQEVTDLKQWAKQILIHGENGKPTWRAIVEQALKRLGGKARLEEIYRTMEPARPTANQWWKEKVRQILQRHFHPVGRGEWSSSPILT